MLSSLFRKSSSRATVARHSAAAALRTARRSLSASAQPQLAASTPQLIRSYPSTQVSTLSNGLRVASENTGGDSATVAVMVDTGSRYESAENNGVAHFLEHLIFKGTKSRTQLQLETEVENMGASLNAYTSREQTVYIIKTFKDDVAKGVEILADIIQNSLLEDDAIERERSVILREMEEVEGQMEEVIFDRLHQTAFRDSSLGATILGPAENIERINRADIQEYIATHYTAPRIVVAAAGDVDHSALDAAVNKEFGQMPSAPTNGVEPAKPAASFTPSDIRVRFDDMNEAHIAFAFETAGVTDPDHFPLMALQNMLGNWDSSVPSGVHSSARLVNKVANDGLANRIMAYNTVYSDTGLFGVYAVTPEPKAINDLMYTITNEMVRLCYTAEDRDVEEAKRQLLMNLMQFYSGSSAAVAEDIGRQMLTLGRRMHPTEVVNRVSSIDSAAVRAVANRFIYDQCFAMAAIGPIYELPDYNWLRRRTYWLRF